MATFDEFYKSIDTDKSGKKFEHFVKWFLKNDSTWKLIVDEIWLWDEYPDRWSRDKGIDLVFKDKQSGIWAVQAKQYDSNNYISKPDIDSFLSESGKQNIKGRLLIASTNSIGPNAMEVISNENTFPPVKTFLLSDFNKAYEEGFEYPANILELKTTKKRTVLEDKKFQTKAVEAALDGFKDADRGQLIMACGTGKTIVTLFVKEQMQSNLTMVMLPSLLLVSNTLRKWTAFTKEDFEFLCVCSDKKVAQSDDDDMSLHEIPLVSNDTQEIKTFLKRDTKRVVFCTYQSSPLIAKVHEDKNIPSFNLIVCDEAHRTVGKKEGLFSIVLDNKLIRANKRLFVTATPRIYSSEIKKKAENLGTEILDMSNKDKYGDKFYEYSFGQAIEENQLSDYQVLVTGVNEKLVKDMIDKRSLIKTKYKNITDSKSYAAQLGVLKGIKEHNLSKIITFHGRVKSAEKFSKEIIKTSSELSEKSKLEGKLFSNHVNGNMSTFVREQKISKLQNVNTSDCYLLSNARCLSEGVDIPTLDGIVFVDPRESEIDIVQTIGRAIRKSNTKTKGTIILPIFIEKNANSEDEVKKSDFKTIWRVINALKAHDYALKEELNAFRNELGRTGKKYISKSIPKFIFNLPEDIGESFEKSLKTRLIEITTESWKFWHGLLQKYIKVYGNILVPRTFIFEGKKLGAWVGNQITHYNHGTLSTERIEQLESLEGWVWDRLEYQWDTGFQDLSDFVKENGHLVIPRSYRSKEGTHLNQWMNVQLLNYRYRELDTKRIARLESIEGWSWDDKKEVLWETAFNNLLDYEKENGSISIMEHGYKTDSGFILGGWISWQQKRYKEKTLEPDRIARLESVSGWTWVADKKDKRWEESFNHLLSFVNENGHLNIPVNLVSKNEKKLNPWVQAQITQYNKRKLTPERIKKLESIEGWVWDRSGHKWEEGYSNLVEFIRENKHSVTPYNFKTIDGFQLGRWVEIQRKTYKEKRIYPERLKRLGSLEGWVWVTSKLDNEWQVNFQELSDFVKENGNLLIPKTYSSKSGSNLYQWVGTQTSRYRINKLIPEKIKKLESIEGWSWDRLEYQWELAFKWVSDFGKETGNYNVPVRYKMKNGFTLGNWCSRQRKDFEENKMTPKRIKKLESLDGWSWDLQQEHWELAFQYLLDYVKINNTPNVPGNYRNNDKFHIGHWIANQRDTYKKQKLSKIKIDKLESIEGWVWNRFNDIWTRGINAASNFVKVNGHAKIGTQYITEDGHPLGKWVSRNREKYKKGKLSKDEISSLESLEGWVWSLDDPWNDNFKRLVSFYNREGHAFVPQEHIEDKFNLNPWVSAQRVKYKKNILSKERIKKLESIEGWVWNAIDEKWNEWNKKWNNGFRHLKIFEEREGHIKFTNRYIENGFALGQWVTVQRNTYKKQKLSEDRIKKLESIKSWSW